MDGPLAPKPLAPGLRPPRVDRTSRDRKRKGRSFDNELAGGHEDHTGASTPGRSPSAHPQLTHRKTDPKPGPQRTPEATDPEESGRLLDLEA